MGIVTSKSKSKSTVVVEPAQPVAAQETAQPQETARLRRKRNRKPLYTGGSVDGKPARGLTSTPDNYTPAQGRLVRGQFKTAEQWFLHCYTMQLWYAQQYKEMAADAAAHPEKYARARSGVAKKELVAQISKLEQALIARGFSAEDIAAMLS